MFTAIAVAVGLILSLTVFFKIETIRVEGSEHYTSEELIAAAGVTTGENLFRVDDRRIADVLTGTYPYIEAVELRRALPATLTIQVTEATPLGAFLQEDGSYVLVSDAGRVLELGTGTPSSTGLVVNGVTIEGAQLCQTIPEENNESLAMLRYLVEAIEATGFENITRIDLSDRLNMYIVYEDRVRIELGSETQLTDKLDFAKYALDNNVREDFEGVMDATVAKRISILPEEIHEEGYHDDPSLETEQPAGTGDGSETDGEPADGQTEPADGEAPRRTGRPQSPPPSRRTAPPGRAPPRRKADRGRGGSSGFAPAGWYDARGAQNSSPGSKNFRTLPDIL